MWSLCKVFWSRSRPVLRRLTGESLSGSTTYGFHLHFLLPKVRTTMAGIPLWDAVNLVLSSVEKTSGSKYTETVHPRSEIFALFLTVYYYAFLIIYLSTFHTEAQLSLSSYVLNSSTPRCDQFVLKLSRIYWYFSRTNCLIFLCNVKSKVREKTKSIQIQQNSISESS